SILGLIAWINQSFITQERDWYRNVRPYQDANVTPYVLRPEADAIAFHPANQTRNTLAAIFAIALSVVPLSAAQPQTGQQRMHGDLRHEPGRDGRNVSLHPARLRGADRADLSHPEQTDSRDRFGVGAQSGRHRVRSEEQPVVAGVARERLEKPPRLSGRASRPYDGVGGSRQRLGRRLRPRIRREARP